MDIILTYFVICYYLLMWTFYIKSIEHFITKLILSQAVHTRYVERYPHGHHTCIMYCIIFSNDRMHIDLTRTKITQQNWISNAMCLSSIFLWSAKRKIQTTKWCSLCLGLFLYNTFSSIVMIYMYNNRVLAKTKHLKCT